MPSRHFKRKKKEPDPNGTLAHRHPAGHLSLDTPSNDWGNESMPKERLHLLLADQSLQMLTSSLGAAPLSDAQNFAYFLGSISPDALFYDLPLIRLSAMGEAFHRLEGESCLPVLTTILREVNTAQDPETAGWVLGVASHFLADGIWHPIIRQMSDPKTLFCQEFKLSKRQCHHWLESELEGYWLARIGPPGGYLPLLRRFRGRTRIRGSCIRHFRVILMHMGLSRIPEEKTIGRCFFWQATLLHLFSLEAWARWRKLLLHSYYGRSLGALLVPPSASPSPLTRIEGNGEIPIQDLCDDAFMARSIKSLAEQLHGLLLNLYPHFARCHPSLKTPNQ
jgi:hypothetical protein